MSMRARALASVSSQRPIVSSLVSATGFDPTMGVPLIRVT
jgi:hypothetical protein